VPARSRVRQRRRPGHRVRARGARAPLLAAHRRRPAPRRAPARDVRGRRAPVAGRGAARVGAGVRTRVVRARHAGEGSRRDHGRLDGRPVAHRDVEAALTCEGDEATLLLAFGSSPDEALGRLDAALAEGVASLLNERERHDRERIGAALAATEDRLEPVYRRSLLVFDLVSDRATGAAIAAPELDPHFVESGGYGFVWPRDLAFTILAYLACGREDLAR